MYNCDAMGGGLVCYKVSSLGLGVDPGTVGAPLEDSTAHRETLPLRRQCIARPSVRWALSTLMQLSEPQKRTLRICQKPQHSNDWRQVEGVASQEPKEFFVL